MSSNPQPIVHEESAFFPQLILNLELNRKTSDLKDGGFPFVLERKCILAAFNVASIICLDSHVLHFKASKQINGSGMLRGLKLA